MLNGTGTKSRMEKKRFYRDLQLKLELDFMAAAAALPVKRS